MSFGFKTWDVFCCFPTVGFPREFITTIGHIFPGDFIKWRDALVLLLRGGGSGAHVSNYDRF